MDQLTLTFFPFPYLHKNERVPGYRVSWATQCNRCDKQCESSRTIGISVCSYGFNFVRLAPDFLLFGLVVQTPNPTNAQKKARRGNPQSILQVEEVLRASSFVRKHLTEIEVEIDNEKNALIDEYRRSHSYKEDFLQLLKPEIEKNLAFLHDYNQFISRIKQHINVVLETRYPGGTLENKLDKALPSEAAIYWPSLLMTEKLQTAFLLLHPERLTPAGRTIFRLHGLILKYVRIYNVAFAEKDIKFEVRGYSSGNVLANSSALAVIPHTLLDNALKYSQRGSQVVLSFKEDNETIEVSVVSYGPKIEAEEAEKIFHIFYRGRNAIKDQEEGAGFGLHLAQFVAKDLGTEIKMSQSLTKSKFGFETTFSVSFRRES